MLFTVITVIALVDKRYEAILIPVDGLAIPFHVSTVKVSVVKSSKLL